MYIHKIKIPYHFLSGYSGFYLCSKKIRCLKTFISGPYFEALFWVCVRPTFCVPPLKMGGGTKSDDFGVCVSVPSQFFWSVPANGIKRVAWKFDILTPNNHKVVQSAVPKAKSLQSQIEHDI